ncbi:MAG TPA: hypothetical protein VGN97_17115 [Mesorhizobium sp.]|jgi:hypothetical protein|nr:hypothetical protein [Mesorhizobium sp.]
MLTAVILAGEGDEERLARTLVSLIPAVLEGFLRDAAVVDGGGAAGLADVADHAGCAFVPDLRTAAETARSDWLLILEAGARLEEPWAGAVRDHIAGSRRPARFRVGGGLLARLLRRGAPFRRGLLVRREEALVKGQAGLARVRAARLGARIEVRG